MDIDTEIKFLFFRYIQMDLTNFRSFFWGGGTMYFLRTKKHYLFSLYTFSIISTLCTDITSREKLDLSLARAASFRIKNQIGERRSPCKRFSLPEMNFLLFLAISQSGNLFRFLLSYFFFKASFKWQFVILKFFLNVHVRYSVVWSF